MKQSSVSPPLSDSMMLQGNEQPAVCLSAGDASLSISHLVISARAAAAPRETVKSRKELEVCVKPNRSLFGGDPLVLIAAVMGKTAGQ